MADDKRPLLDRTDKKVHGRDERANIEHPQSRSGLTGSNYHYGTWDESSAGRQEPGLSTTGDKLVDSAPADGSEDNSLPTSAPTAASIGDSLAVTSPVPYTGTLCINSAPEEAILPDNSEETGHLHSVILDPPSGLAHQRGSQELKADGQDTAHQTSNSGGDTTAPHHPGVSSSSRASSPSSSSPNLSHHFDIPSDKYPLNIKNKAKKIRSATPVLGNRVRPGQGIDDPGRSGQSPEPNMEHAVHFKSAKNGTTVQDKDEKTPFFVYYLACFATIGGLLFGYDTGIVSGSMLLIKDYYKLSTIWQELIVSATVAAAAVFSLCAGLMCDVFGRKTTIMIASVVFVAGAVVMGAAQNKEMLVAGRIVVGIAIGFASMAVPVYVAEAAPPAIRGRLVTINQLFITIGILISSIIAGGFSSLKETGWRYMLALAAVPAIIQLIGFVYLPESPRWYMMKGREEEALAVLQRIRGKADVQGEIDEIKEVLEEDKKNSGIALGRVFGTPHVRKALFVGCGLQVFQQLCGINTVIYYSATILKMAGFPPQDAIWLVLVPNGINFLSTFIGVLLVERLGRKKLMIISFIGVLISLIVLAVGFQLSANFSPSIHNVTETFDPYFINTTDTCLTRMFSNCEKCIEDTDCGFCFTGDGVNGTCLNINTEDEDIYSAWGRCNETNKGEFGMKYAHGYCPTDYTWMAVLGLALFVLSFAPGLGPMPWTINSEIYPMWARSTGNSLATGCNWICNLLVSLFFLTLTETITKYGAFWLFGGISLLGMMFTIIFLPETKNKSLEEVEELFKGKQKGGSDNLGYEREIPPPQNKDNTRL